MESRFLPVAPHHHQRTSLDPISERLLLWRETASLVSLSFSGVLVVHGQDQCYMLWSRRAGQRQLGTSGASMSDGFSRRPGSIS